MILEGISKYPSHSKKLVSGVLMELSPTLGNLIAISPEEIVIKPQELDGSTPLVDARIHFPRLGFVVKPLDIANL